MAEKRMFAKSIVLTDAFLDMPMSARCLYFTLGMLADDDGFVGSPKSIMRQCGASPDDLAVLLTKRFVLGFDSGVLVIKHWRINNYLQASRHHPTNYQEELATLMLDEKGAYTEANKTPCLTDVEQPLNNCRQDADIDKNSIDKNRLDKSSTGDFDRVAEAWNSLGLSKVSKIASGTERYNLLNKRIKDYGIDRVLEAIENVRKSSFLMGGGKNGWTATFDWFIKPNNFPKVLDGNYIDTDKPNKNSGRVQSIPPGDAKDIWKLVDRI